MPVLTFTILSDDALPAVAFASSAYTVSEAGGSASISVRLNHPSVLTSTVAYATADGTARAGSDYLAATGTLTFAPLMTSSTLAISLVSDTQREPVETLTIKLSNPVNATLLAPNQLTLFIDEELARNKVYLPLIRR